MPIVVTVIVETSNPGSQSWDTVLFLPFFLSFLDLDVEKMEDSESRIAK